MLGFPVAGWLEAESPCGAEGQLAVGWGWQLSTLSRQGHARSQCLGVPELRGILHPITSYVEAQVGFLTWVLERGVGMWGQMCRAGVVCGWQKPWRRHPSLTPHGVITPRAYLEVHQLELEKLSTQIRESKRNSRLVSVTWEEPYGERYFGQTAGVAGTPGAARGPSVSQGRACFCGDVRGQPRLLVLGFVGLLSYCHALSSPGWVLHVPAHVLRMVGAMCWGLLGLCCVLSLSSLLQGFLYDLDKVSGISALASLVSPFPSTWDVLLPAPLRLHCPTACPLSLQGGMGDLWARWVWAGDEGSSL